MKQMLKKIAAFVVVLGMTTGMSMPAMANPNIDMSLGPGYMQYLEEQGMKEEIQPMPGMDQSVVTSPVETVPVESPAATVPEATSPVTETPQYSGNLVPNTVKYGGHVDITPTNEAAIWDAVEIGSTPAEKPGQLIWVSAKLKDGFNGKLSYRPYVNNGGWLKF